MSELEDRRQQAREAAQDEHGQSEYYGAEAANAVEAAIETATRVRITPEILAAARLAAEGSWTEEPGPRQVARLRAAFEAAGLEVEG